VGALDNKKQTVIYSGSSGLIGFLAGKLTGGDFKALASQILDGSFKFLHEQGAYASFAIVITVAFTGVAIWAIRLLVNGKQAEIDRVVEERNKLQHLFIEDYQSSRSEQRASRKK
jgi:hypothetical protein